MTPIAGVKLSKAAQAVINDIEKYLDAMKVCGKPKPEVVTLMPDKAETLRKSLKKSPKFKYAIDAKIDPVKCALAHGVKIEIYEQ